MNEIDWAEVPYPALGQGQAGPAEPVAEDDHPHMFLYLPDLSSETGWAGHRVRERKPERTERSVGFRWRR